MSASPSDFVALLFHRHGRDLLGFLRTRLRPQEVEDVAQRTYLQLLQHPNPDEIRDPQAYLFRTASNMAIDYLRERHVRTRDVEPDAELESVVSPAPQPDACVDGELILRRFLAVLDGLPPLCQHAFLLNRVDGLTHAEIARRLGISKKTVERYIIKAFQKCLDELDPLS
jgi:RNA polymerase sigma-70 factor (ECF subfamily)